MRLGWWITIPLFGGLLACNAILGVEDVDLRTTVPRAEPRQEDPDDGTDGNGGDTDPGDTDPGDTDPGDTKPGADEECNGVPDCERLMFVTGATFTGNLGGLEGADQKCFEAAKQISGYGGRKFVAWLSDATKTAAQRIPHGTKPFRRTDGKAIANSYEDLIDGSLALPALDEKGKPLPGSGFDVWTGTSSAGDRYDDTCVGWTSADGGDFGTYGSSNATGATWTDTEAVFSCNTEMHLYCIEF